MNTPREILFERHQAVMPKLDALRQGTVAAVCDRRSPANDACEQRSQTSVTTAMRTLWLELVWPCRRIWKGLAAVWVLLLIFNYTQRDSSQVHMVKSSSPAALTMTFRDQQKILNELFADRAQPPEAVRPRIFSPKPRTETIRFETA